MSKPSSLWFRKENNHWYTTIHGTQHKLSRDKSEARRMLNKLLAEDKPPPKKTGLSTRKLCDNYLVRTRDQKEERSHTVQVAHLAAFCKALGHRDPATLKVYEVEEWLEKQETWAASTRALFITIIKAVFNFGEQQGYLTTNPIKKLKRRKTGRREKVVTPEERDRFLAEASQNFKDFLLVLDMTGCRPFSEAARITAADIDWQSNRIVLQKHKTRKKTDRPRTIYIPAALAPRLRELAERYPTGAILRNRLGNAWSADTAGKYCKRICERIGLTGITLYNLRTTYISEALVAGIPVETVAALCGNTPKVIWEHYNRVDKIEDAMRAAAEKAVE